MNKIIKLFWLLSLIGFLTTLLIVYAGLPVRLNVSLGSTVLRELYLTKNAFFYTMIAIVVLTNATLLALAKAFSLMPSGKLNQGTGFIKSGVFKMNLINWLGSFSFILNLFYCMAVMFTGFYNNPEFVSASPHRFLVYVSLILIVGWLIGLVFIIVRRNKVGNRE